MKNQLLIIATLALSLVFSSCKKDENNDTQPTTQTPTPTPTSTTSNELFIAFTLDGVATNIKRTSNSQNSGYGGGSYTSATFFDLNTDIGIGLDMPLDSILGSDMESLIGQKIPVASCGGCPTNMDLSYKINGDSYKSYDSNNPLPDNYFKITSVKFHKTKNQFGRNLNEYYVTGEFNVKLSYGTNIKNAKDGTFRMIFQEAKH